MASHSRSRRRLSSAYKYNYKGRHRAHRSHRAARPKASLGVARRIAIAVPLSMTLALYPVVAGDGSGIRPKLELPQFEERKLPQAHQPEPIVAFKGVSTEPTDPVDDETPVDELLSLRSILWW